jgi:hypothetical protein
MLTAPPVEVQSLGSVQSGDGGWAGGQRAGPRLYALPRAHLHSGRESVGVDDRQCTKYKQRTHHFFV